MAVPELPPTDWKAACNVWNKAHRKPDGSGYEVFAPDAANPKSIAGFAKGLRTQQDYVEGHDLQIKDLDTRVKTLNSSTDTRLDNLAKRVTALEESQTFAPFPGST